MTDSLYYSDFLLWTKDTVTKLLQRDYDHLDWENLIQEIADLGNACRDELESRLEVLFEHYLKRLYVPFPDAFNGWERTIREQRRRIKRRLQKTPSLRAFWDTAVAQAWQYAREAVGEDYPQCQFPEQWQYGTDIDTLLTVNFWEIRTT